ncbi:hypothetical protein BGX29_011747 [Mortierella sp. GBA35]|nr:hypothetical protein BGX29_011747 [Mortierella sp. GBA35]
MAGTTSPTIRAHNAKCRPSGGGASASAGGPPSPVTAYADRKVTKPIVNPYLTGFLLVMLSGGAILQVLRLLASALMIWMITIRVVGGEEK